LRDHQYGERQHPCAVEVLGAFREAVQKPIQGGESEQQGLETHPSVCEVRLEFKAVSGVRRWQRVNEDSLWRKGKVKSQRAKVKSIIKKD
jgi:hypothetical protein